MQMGQRDEDMMMMMMMMQSIQSKLEMAGRGDEKQELWTGAVSREGQKT